MFAPNTENSSTSSPTTTNVVKNKERTSFETAYQSDYGHSEGHGTHVVFDTTATLSLNEQLVSDLSSNPCEREREKTNLLIFLL